MAARFRKLCAPDPRGERGRGVRGLSPKGCVLLGEMDRSLSLFVNFDCDSSSEGLVGGRRFCGLEDFFCECFGV